MSQMGATLGDFLNGAGPKPTPSDMWPPHEWVELDNPGLNIRHLMHRTGLQIFRVDGGTVVVDRGPAEARRIANIVEDFLWGTGYTLRAGGQVGDQTAVYVRRER